MRGMEVRLSVSVRRLFLVPPGLRKNAADRLQLLPGSATWLAGSRQSCAGVVMRVFPSAC